MMKLCIMPKEPFNNKKKAKIIKDKNCYYIKKNFKPILLSFKRNDIIPSGGEEGMV